MNKNLLFQICMSFVLLLLATASAQVVFKGTCPDNIQVVSDFDVEKYLSNWYEYAKYPDHFEANGKCITAQYSLTEDGIVEVKNSLVNERTGAFLDILGTATLVESGKLLVKFPVSPAINVSSNYWVLDTDYENYSVVYSCSQKSKRKHSVIVWILTRQAIPEATYIEKAVQVLKDNNISLNELQITNQIACNESRV